MFNSTEVFLMTFKSFLIPPIPINNFSDNFMNESDDSQRLFIRNFQSHASGRQKKYCIAFWRDFLNEWRRVKSLNFTVL